VTVVVGLKVAEEAGDVQDESTTRQKRVIVHMTLV